MIICFCYFKLKLNHESVEGNKKKKKKRSLQWCTLIIISFILYLYLAYSMNSYLFFSVSFMWHHIIRFSEPCVPETEWSPPCMVSSILSPGLTDFCTINLLRSWIPELGRLDDRRSMQTKKCDPPSKSIWKKEDRRSVSLKGWPRVMKWNN